MTSCHFAQKPGNGGKPETAASRHAEYKDDPGTPSRERPILQAFLANVTGEPEKSDLGEKMIDEQPADDEESSVARIELLQQSGCDNQQAHLADRGISEKALHLCLPKTDEHLRK